MNRRILAIIISLLISVMMVVPVFAEGTGYIYDQGGNIKDSIEESLNDLGKSIFDASGISVVYVDYEGTKDNGDYIDELAKSYGDCVIMIHNLKTNKVLTRAYEKAADIFSEAKLDELFELYDKEPTYEDGCEAYMTGAKGFIEKSGDFKKETATTKEETKKVEPSSSVDKKREIPPKRQAERLVDKADLLTDAQEANILHKLDTLSEEKQKDVVIYFTDHFDEDTVTAAADDYYDYNGFGYGEEREGILMFVCMETRDVYFSTCGSQTIAQFTDSNIDTMVSDVTPYLSCNDYAGACDEYISDVEYYTVHHFNFLFAGIIFAAFALIGLIIGSVRVSKERNKLVSVRYEYDADEYVKPGSYNCTYKNETFVRRDVSRVYDPIPEDDSSGSSTHESSSGTTHGGGGGKF